MRWLFLILAISTVAGCTTHYYKTQNDLVSIYLKKNAQQVYFASSIDRYTLHPIDRNGKGCWEIQVSGNEAFRYFYVVDGKVYVPDCRFKEFDDFGMQNCIFMPTGATDISQSKTTSK